MSTKYKYSIQQILLNYIRNHKSLEQEYCIKFLWPIFLPIFQVIIFGSKKWSQFHMNLYQILNQLKKMMEKDYSASYDQKIPSQMLNSQKIILKSPFYEKDQNNYIIYRLLACTKTNIFIYEWEKKNEAQDLQFQSSKPLETLHLNITIEINQEKNQLNNNDEYPETKFTFYSSFIKIKEFYTRNPQTIRVWREFLEIYFNQCSFNKKFSKFLKLQNKEYYTFYEATATQTNKKVLIKAFSKQIIYCSYNYKNKLFNEIKLLRILHEHGIKILLGIFETQSSIYLILQSEITSLQKFLKNKNKYVLSSESAQIIIYSIISQIMKLHTCKITYENLQLQNIYLNPNKIEEKNIKLLNFQNSHIFQQNQNKDQQNVQTKIFEQLKKKDITGIEKIIIILNDYIVHQTQEKKQTDENIVSKIDESKSDPQMKQIYNKLCNKIFREKKSKFKGLKQNKQENLSKTVC